MCLLCKRSRENEVRDELKGVALRGLTGMPPEDSERVDRVQTFGY